MFSGWFGSGAKFFAALACVFMLAVSASVDAHAQSTQYRWEENGFAIDGYDVVSYYRDGVVRQGEARYSYEYQGLVWLFAARQHMERFIERPQQFVPAFGGFCGFSMARGAALRPDPENWVILDNGKLVLFAREGHIQTFLADLENVWGLAVRNYNTLADQYRARISRDG